MKTVYEKASDSIYIYILEGIEIDSTYCCNPLKIKQDFINFDISVDNKIIGIEIIKGSFLNNFIKKKGKMIISFDSINEKMIFNFNNGIESYNYINNDTNYDEDNFLFGNILISFDNNGEILNIIFNDITNILDLDKFSLHNKWIDL